MASDDQADVGKKLSDAGDQLSAVSEELGAVARQGSADLQQRWLELLAEWWSRLDSEDRAFFLLYRERSQPTLDVVSRLTATGAPVLFEWPDGLQDFLASRSEPGGD